MSHSRVLFVQLYLQQGHVIVELYLQQGQVGVEFTCDRASEGGFTCITDAASLTPFMGKLAHMQTFIEAHAPVCIWLQGQFSTNAHTAVHMHLYAYCICRLWSNGIQPSQLCCPLHSGGCLVTHHVPGTHGSECAVWQFPVGWTCIAESWQFCCQKPCQCYRHSGRVLGQWLWCLHTNSRC